jgi:16S rRNA (uracil1498-N3)-methyltransferase
MISVVIDKKKISLDNKIVIDEKNDVNHLKNVFRIKEGDEVRVVDGEKEYLTKVLEIENKKITVEIKTVKDDNYTPKIEVHAAVGILKNDKMDLLIQKLTEIGISKIIPISAKRTVVKLSEKKEKWDIISKEALKQCQGVKFLEIMEMTKLNGINYEEYDMIVVPYECEDDNKIFTVFEKNPKKVLYVIGPEGGFESEEIEFLKGKGAVVVTLGKRILRAETAAIVAGGILVNGFN